MPSLLRRLSSALCILGLVAAAAGVTATVILWPRELAAVARAL